MLCFIFLKIPLVTKWNSTDARIKGDPSKDTTRPENAGDVQIFPVFYRLPKEWWFYQYLCHTGIFCFGFELIGTQPCYTGGLFTNEEQKKGWLMMLYITATHAGLFHKVLDTDCQT